MGLVTAAAAAACVGSACVAALAAPSTLIAARTRTHASFSKNQAWKNSNNATCNAYAARTSMSRCVTCWQGQSDVDVDLTNSNDNICNNERDEDDDDDRPPTFVLSGASRYQDYVELGELLVATFDDDTSTDSNGITDAGIGNNMEGWLWNAGVTKALTAKKYTNRYLSTVRKMRGKKYSLLLAKSFGTTGSNSNPIDEESGPIKPGTVVGVAEIGLSTYPLVPASSDTSNTGTTGVVASIGVLAVAQSQRRSGMASALLKAAESVVQRWNETHLYAAVEPSNTNALQFFERCGYGAVGLDDGDDNREETASITMVSVEVSERVRSSMRPHILLRREISNNTT